MSRDPTTSGSPSAKARRIPPAFLRRVDSTTFTDNEKRLLDLVRQHGALSRADLARHTDLAMQSVVRLVDGLVARRFLKAGDKVIRGPGQPSTPMSLEPDSAFIFGVSVMTDSVSGLLMDLAGRTRTRFVDPVDVSSRRAVVEHLAARLARAAAEAGVERSRIFGVGVAATGYFVGDAVINPPSGMDEWALVDLEAALSEALDLPVWLENDGNAGAAGESLFGVGQRYRSFAYLHVAKGLGGGLVLDGRLWRGLNGNAGEFTGLLPAGDRPNRPTLALLQEILAERGAPVASVSDIVRDFDPAWPGVETWLERTRPALTAILSSIAAVLDPDAIVIGGLAPRPLAALMAANASFYGVPTRGRERPFPPVVAAEAVGDAAALGAAAIPLKEHFFG